MNYALSHFIPLLKRTYTEWQEDKAPMWGAAIAYYTVFSLAPLLIVIIAITGFFLGPEAVKGEVFNGLKSFLGTDAATLIQTMIKGASKKESSIISASIGIITLLLGASGIFGQMKESLNFIWKVKTKPSAGIKAILIDRFTNLSMVGVICFLLLVSFVASSATSLISQYLLHALPFSPLIIETFNFLISLSVTSVLFMLIYKVLPDVELPWGVSWLGGIFTGILFTIGKTVIGLYIGSAALSSSYGSAASLITLLIWVYYSAQILLFGAAFTKAYVLEREISIQPSKLAVYNDNLIEEIEERKFATQMKELRPLVGFFLSGLLAELISRLFHKKKR